MSKALRNVLLSTNISQEVKRRDFFDPQNPNLFTEDSNFMVNLLELPRMIVFFFYYMIELPQLFQRRSCVLYFVERA